MPDENKSAETAGAAEITAAPAPTNDIGEPSEMELINGGVDFDAVLIDKSEERVKIRVLPFTLQQEYAQLVQAHDEAGRVELLCNKQDKSRDYNLASARGTEERLIELLRATPLDKQKEIEERLRKTRDEISALEARPRWSESLSEEALVEILKIGERLNAKRVGRFVARTNEATGRMLSTIVSRKVSSSPQSSSSSS